MVPTKVRNLESERNGRNESIRKEQHSPGDSVPRPLGFYRFDANPS